PSSHAIRSRRNASCASSYCRRVPLGVAGGYCVRLRLRRPITVISAPSRMRAAAIVAIRAIAAPVTDSPRLPTTGRVVVVVAAAVVVVVTPATVVVVTPATVVVLGAIVVVAGQGDTVVVVATA